jgi:translocation and assembly module TamB
VFEDTRRALGVDDLDIGFGEGGPTVGISRAISNRVRIGVRAGARPESTGVGVDIDLTRRLRLQSEVGADGRAAVGIGIEQEY